MSHDLPVLAVTATCTKSTKDRIVRSLNMEKICVIGLSPNRDNIFLSVISTSTLSDLIRPIAADLRIQNIKFRKTLIFCRTYNDCNIMFDELERALGPYITYPPSYPKIRKYRIIDLYTRGSTNKAKEEILQDFVKSDTHIRLIVATTAFGMGIDCADIKHVIHWGPPHTVEEYVQEAGRAGRNEEQCCATLVYNKPRGAISAEMKLYGQNTTICRRELLYKYFLFHTGTQLNPLCLCCDVCSLVCNCPSCKL